MFENNLTAEFGKDIWFDKMTNFYDAANKAHIAADNKQNFMNDHIWQEINDTIANYAKSDTSVKKYTVALVALDETCDGGCLEAHISVSYTDNNTISSCAINLQSWY